MDWKYFIYFLLLIMLACFIYFLNKNWEKTKKAVGGATINDKVDLRYRAWMILLLLVTSAIYNFLKFICIL